MNSFYKDNWSFYKNKLTYVLIGLALIFGVHGLYVFYVPIISKPWQLFSAVFYGTMKLFLFSPPLAVTDDAPLTYEIAKWLAPIMTSALVLTKATNIFLNFKNKLSNHYSKDLFLVFNIDEDSRILVKSLIKEENKSVNIISKVELNEDIQNQLEKMGAPVHKGDIKNMGPRERREILKSIRFNEARLIFITGKDDYDNYVLSLHLLKNIENSNIRTFYIEMESSDLMEFLEHHLEKLKSKSSQYDNIHLSFFNLAELTVRHMLLHPFKENKVLSKAIESNSSPHFVIAGINELTVPTLLQLINLATINIEEAIKISFVDDNPKDKMMAHLSNYEQLSLGMDYFYYDSNELGKIEDVHYYFLLHENPLINLEILSKLSKREDPVPIAFRNKGSRELENLLKEDYSQIFFFGNREEIVNSNIIIQEELDEKAKSFNESYGRASEAAGMGSGASWEDLSPIKKYSSRASAVHGEVKLKIIEKYNPTLKNEVLRKYLERENAKLKDMQSLYSQGGEVFAEEFRNYLAANPILDCMAKLEHLRWCRSYYALNFTLGDKKDEFAKTHPCLIEDWDRVKGDKFLICHPEYDLLALFALKEVL